MSDCDAGHLAQALKGYHVLLAEDSEINQAIVAYQLESSGARVTVTDNGAEALRLLETDASDVDLVLMDLHMPVMDGLQAAQHLAKLRPTLPVIGISGGAALRDQQAQTYPGFARLLSKPVDPDALVAAIVAALSGTEMDHVAPTTPSSDRLHGFDWDQFVSQLGGNASLARAILSEICTSRSDVDQLLAKLLDQSRYDEIAQLAHKLAGEAAILCSEPLVEAAHAVERAASQPAAKTEIEAVVKQLIDLLGAWLPVLARYRQT